MDGNYLYVDTNSTAGIQPGYNIDPSYDVPWIGNYLYLDTNNTAGIQPGYHIDPSHDVPWIGNFLFQGRSSHFRARLSRDFQPF